MSVRNEELLWSTQHALQVCLESLIVYHKLCVGWHFSWSSGLAPWKPPITVFVTSPGFWGSKFLETPLTFTGWRSVSRSLMGEHSHCGFNQSLASGTISDFRRNCSHLWLNTLFHSGFGWVFHNSCYSLHSFILSWIPTWVALLIHWSSKSGLTKKMQDEAKDRAGDSYQFPRSLSGECPSRESQKQRQENLGAQRSKTTFGSWAFRLWWESGAFWVKALVQIRCGMLSNNYWTS